ncbi:MAG: hypothetical protein ACMXYG_03035 [Candidatus Woesearchaeota archaeon]
MKSLDIIIEDDRGKYPAVMEFKSSEGLGGCHGITFPVVITGDFGVEHRRVKVFYEQSYDDKGRSFTQDPNKEAINSNNALNILRGKGYSVIPYNGLIHSSNSKMLVMSDLSLDADFVLDEKEIHRPNSLFESLDNKKELIKAMYKTTLLNSCNGFSMGFGVSHMICVKDNIGQAYVVDVSEFMRNDIINGELYNFIEDIYLKNLDLVLPQEDIEYLKLFFLSISNRIAKSDLPTLLDSRLEMLLQIKDFSELGDKINLSYYLSSSLLNFCEFSDINIDKIPATYKVALSSVAYALHVTKGLDVSQQIQQINESLSEGENLFIDAKVFQTSVEVVKYTEVLLSDRKYQVTFKLPFIDALRLDSYGLLPEYFDASCISNIEEVVSFNVVGTIPDIKLVYQTKPLNQKFDVFRVKKEIMFPSSSEVCYLYNDGSRYKPFMYVCEDKII